MNKMKKAIQSLQTVLAMLALVCVSLASFTACSDDDEPVAEVTYSWEFKEVSPSTPDFMDDKNKIESTFKNALGATATATSVTKQGTPETCDKEVLEACQQAFNSLKDEAWQGRYTFTVTNVTTGTEIFSHTFDADNENSFEASSLKFGDYYYSDGTWSDGGLREINGNGNMTWAESKPEPESGKTVIGIVFYTGRHPNDKSDYSQPLTENGPTLPDGKVQGYVVALTDVHNDDSDLLCWEWKDGTYNRSVGTSTNENDWNGYANCQQIHKFVVDNSSDGWEMKHFPAALACETYGKRTLDRYGNSTTAYDWQKPLAAPSNTSGWFLPSCAQLLHLCNNRSSLSARMTEVKNSTRADCDYKDKIKWFDTSYYYWSSTERLIYPHDAWFVYFNDDYQSSFNKDLPFNVRAVLAF